MTYHCDTCQAHFEIKFVGPANKVGSPNFCPRCGTLLGLHVHMVGNVPDSELWKCFTKAHDLPSVEVAKDVYRLWDPNVHTTFQEHLKDLMSE